MMNYLKKQYTAYKKRGFTLIELIVVMAVIAVLVLLAVPRFLGQTEKAHVAQIKNDVRVVESKVDEYLISHQNLDDWEGPVVLSGDNLYNKKGLVNDDNPVQPGSYRLVSDEILKEVKSKLDGTFYANSDGKVYYEHEKPLLGIPTEPGENEPGTPEGPKEPGYSGEEIQDLIEKNYIPIATAEELNNVRSATLETYGKGTDWEGEYTGGLNKQYVQVANVDLSGYSEEGWNPIGTESLTFRGTYDGGNYVITGLEVKGESKSNQGLFGRTQEATIKNVGLIDNKVTGSKWVGGLVGYASNITIENSYATGAVKGTSRVGGLVGLSNSNSTISNSYATGSVESTSKEYAGGLVGSVSQSTIENSYATGPVKGSDYVGGLVGYSYNSTIDNSYATGKVEGTEYVGGLVGQALYNSSYAGNSNISNSYATGKVTGNNRFVGGLVGSSKQSVTISNSYATGSVEGGGLVGGLVGVAEFFTTIENSYATGSVTGTSTRLGQVGGFVGYNSYGIISNSYATGKVTSSGDEVGGFVGKFGGGKISSSYWDKGTTEQEESARGEGKTTEEMKEEKTYSGWDFDTVWKIDEGNDYPKLR